MADRTVSSRWDRVYLDGYDFSGQARSVGPLELKFDSADLTTLADSLKGYLRGHPHANVGAINAVFDTTAVTGGHALFKTSGVKRTVLVARGMGAAPAAGNPCFGGQFTQAGYQAADAGGAAVVNMPFSGWAEDAVTLTYVSPWGQLLHANSAATAANTALGLDNDTGGATTHGGYLLYHVLDSSNAVHTATLSVDDGAANTVDGDFSALSGATTGVITVTAGVFGIVALSASATVRRYLRWQMALGTATSVTFVAAFFRG